MRRSRKQFSSGGGPNHDALKRGGVKKKIRKRIYIGNQVEENKFFQTKKRTTVLVLYKK